MTPLVAYTPRNRVLREAMIPSAGDSVDMLVLEESFGTAKLCTGVKESTQSAPTLPEPEKDSTTILGHEVVGTE
jgi:hypothetical protein